MDRYSARMNLRGSTQRERELNRLKSDIIRKAPNSLSYKNIKLNGEPTQLIINTGTQPYYKEFQSLPNQEINIGDYIEWANSHWIVVACDFDDEIYRDGKLNQCNYLLKWQNELGEIIERWAVIQSASKYNDGTTSNNVISLGSDQLSIIIPLDDESLKLKKSMSKKFFIDFNKEDPTTYELTNTGNVPDTYNGHGVTSWIVKECAYSASDDDLKHGVCNYTEVSNPTSPTPPQLSNPNETAVLNTTISGTTNLKIGISRTYTVNFTDKSGNDIQWNNVDFAWNVVSDFKVEQKISENKISLIVEDEDCIYSFFVLQVINVNEGSVMSEIEINVIEGF